MRTSIIYAAFSSLVLSTIVPVISYGQQEPADPVERFDRFRKRQLTEKLFVHTDQTLYLVGESLRFSMYAVDGTMHLPLDMSKIAYVEIVDEDNSPVLQTKVELVNGRGDGSVYIPVSLNSGNYLLRAYTRWMRNAPADFFFHQRITIINQFVGPPPASESKKISSPTINFFPEGGNLVAGLPSRVAFRITDANGRGLAAGGTIIGPQNDTITRFFPERFGIGSFQFTPVEGINYRVVLTDENEKASLHDFPVAHTEGAVLHLKEEDENIVISLQGKYAHSAFSNIFLFGHTRQMIFTRQTQAWDGRQIVFIVPKETLPDGIAHFTVFDERGIPLCERLYYKFPGKQLNIRLTVSQTVPETRRKVTARIKTDVVGDLADLSVAVFKRDSLSVFSPASIYPYLWLTSDLTGEIEHPEFYFNNESEGIQHIDLLMLTHGWRRFQWSDLARTESALKYTPELRGHTIEAFVEKGGTPVAGELAYLSRPGKEIELYAAKSNAQGEWIYEIKPRPGKRKLIIQPASQDPSVRIRLKSPFSETFVQLPRIPWLVSPAMNDNLRNRSVAVQVQDIFQRESSTPDSVENTIPFYGAADEHYDLDDYTRFPVMEEVMREYVTGVMVRKRRDGFHFLVINQQQRGVFEEPMILLDGFPVLHADQIMNLDPLRINTLDVVGRRYYLGGTTLNGIVSYKSYEHDFAGLEPLPGSLSIDYEVLQQHREFHHPQYSTRDQMASRIPDRRYLLYWNPQVTTNDEGEAEITFYTSDIKGTFEIHVHGLSADGRAGSATRTFKVE